MSYSWKCTRYYGKPYSYWKGAFNLNFCSKIREIKAAKWHISATLVQTNDGTHFPFGSISIPVAAAILSKEKEAILWLEKFCFQSNLF